MPAESLVEGFRLDQAQAGNLLSLSGPIEIIFLKYVFEALKVPKCEIFNCSDFHLFLRHKAFLDR